MVRYETGVDPYLYVITAQTTVLSGQETLATLQIEQMVAAVNLIEALGGGWDRSQLPTASQVSKKPSAGDYKLQH
jgi:outer membrane protein TolC